MLWKSGTDVLGYVEFIYDQGFRVRELNVKGTHIPYQYNVEGEPVQAGDLSITRDPATGLITNTRLGTLTGDYAFNSYGESESSTYVQGSSQLLTFNYQREKLGRIIQKTTTDRTNTTKVQTFSYDTIGRLISESTNGVSTSYSYDVNGNRLNNNSVYDAQDRLVENTDFQFFYDKSGFLTEKRRKSDNQSIFYTYDSFGRLLKVDDRIKNKVIEYTVDPEGRRIAKKVNGFPTLAWIYKDGLKPVGELEYLTETVPRFYLKKVFIYGTNPYAPDAFVNIVDNKTYRMINDHLGSPRMVVDANSGEVVQEMDYDTWGNVVSDSSPGLTPFGFAGGLYDPDTGLVRFGARDYDPSIGRWLDKDPEIFDGGINFYLYSINDPINKIDIDGLKPGDLYDTPTAAARDALNDIIDQSILEDIEYAGEIYKTETNKYSYTPPRPGDAHSSKVNFNRIPKGSKKTGWYHTHGKESGKKYDDEHFSKDDKSICHKHQVPGHVMTPSKKHKVYNPYK